MLHKNQISIMVLMTIGCLTRIYGSSNSSSTESIPDNPSFGSSASLSYYKTPVPSVDPTHLPTDVPFSSSSQTSTIAPSSSSTPPSSVSQSSSQTPPISHSVSFSITPSPASSSSSLGSSSSHMTPPSNSSTLLPNSTMSVSSSLNITSVSGTTEAPSVSPSKRTSSHIKPSKSSKPHPSPSTSPPKVIVECGEECKSLKKRLWAAGVFAVLLGVTTLVFMFLLFRQCRIAKEYNDPALSRLI